MFGGTSAQLINIYAQTLVLLQDVRLPLHMVFLLTRTPLQTDPRLNTVRRMQILARVLHEESVAHHRAVTALRAAQSYPVHDGSAGREGRENGGRDCESGLGGLLPRYEAI
jgi:hypothetical protein